MKQRFNKCCILVAALISTLPFTAFANDSVCDRPTKSILVGKATCTSDLCKLSNGSNGLPSTGIGALLQLAQAQASSSLPNVSNLTNDLSNMLASSLQQTKCFNVVDQDSIEQAKAQMATLGKTFTPPRVDYIVNATVSDVSMDDNQQNLLFIKLGSKSAKITVSTKIIDPNTGSLLDSGSYHSSTSDAAARFEVGGLLQVGQGDKQMDLTSVVRDAAMQASSDIAKKFK